MEQLLTKGRDFWLWGVVFAAGIVVFLLAPGAGSDKSRAVLHGLCAQTPTHSFEFGGTLLPFDGRMTGIYGGSILTIVSLIASRRVLFYGNPPLRVVLGLAAGVGLMAVDGFNSLLTDLEMWHPYESQNILRLVTGYLTGVALGVASCWLLGSSIWRLSRDKEGVRSFRDLIFPVGLLLPYAAVVVSGWDVLLVPITFFLMTAAWITLATLMLVVVLLLFRYEDQIANTRQLHIPGAIASGLALMIMLGLAGGRFWLERALGLPSLL
jgi:uncharacterized membrane protein